MERVNMRVGNTIVLILFALLMFPLVNANVLVFSNYDTQATITEDRIEIEREVTIKNNGQAPIIPGELHFRFFEQEGDEKQSILIDNVAAESQTGETLRTRSVDRGDEQDVSVQVWNPLLPGFDYTFTMRYDIMFETEGLLFHEISLPREQTTVAIENERTRFYLDDKYHVTYAPRTEVSSMTGMSVVEWSPNEDQRTVEYSRIPFPQTGVRGVNVFWITIILALLAVFTVSFLKQRSEPRRKQYVQQPYNNQQYGGGQR